MGCSGSKGNSEIRPHGGGAKAPTSPGGGGKLLDKYALGKVLGQGAFGVVYSCKKKGTKDEFAVKMIDQVETPLAEIRQEAEMLFKLNHPCVVKLHDVYYEKVFVCMVMDIYRGGDMIEGMQLHWKTKGMLPIPVVQNVSKQMVDGIAWLHKNSVVHRDVKGDNYLMDRNTIESTDIRVYLSDFGTVCDIGPNERLSHKCGTKTYWSPEFFKLAYGLKVDIWAIGVVMFGLVTGRFPFKGEDDVKSKKISLPRRCPPDGEEFIKSMLDRDEAKRFTAEGALKHQFLAAIKSGHEAESMMDDDFKPEVKETGANAGVRERRRELVERLEDANQQQAQSAARMTYKQLVGASFEVADRGAEKTSRFEWWPQSKAKENNFWDASKARPAGGEEYNGDSSVEEIRKMLEEHNIVTGHFGKGQAKSFREFVFEVQNGSARLMLDATQHKTVVRVVDVVLLRLCIVHQGTKRFLVKKVEKFPDGREKKDLNQLPGTKKAPHENGRQTTERVLRERLRMTDCKIQFDFMKGEAFEESEESPSYPGVRTVYRKEIFEGTITAIDMKTLERIGVIGGSMVNEDQDKYVRTYTWLDEKTCAKQKVMLRAPKSTGDISALVHAPIGLAEEALQSFLVSNNVDVSKFGTAGNKTLNEFSEELVKGEAQLVRQDDGRVMRVVDVVVMQIVKPSGEVLVEVSEQASGVTKALNRLPAVKRRPDENQFLAAHRVLNKVLRISSNMIGIDPKNVLIVEEQKQSDRYVGLPTVYRKRIITATILEDASVF